MPEFVGTIATVEEPQKSKAGDKWKTALIEVETGGDFTKRFRVWPYNGQDLNPLYEKAKANVGETVTIQYVEDSYQGSRGPVKQNMIQDLRTADESVSGGSWGSNGSGGASSGSGAAQGFSAAQEQRVREITRQEILSFMGKQDTSPVETLDPTKLPDYEAFLTKATDAGVSEKFIEAQYKAIGGDGSWRTANEAELIVLEEKLGLGASF